MRRMWRSIGLACLAATCLLGTGLPSASASAVTDEQATAIRQLVTEKMAEAQIPGLALAVVNLATGERYTVGYGVTDVETQQAVTPTTLFELGSVTKAFTGLAVLRAEEQGLLTKADPVGRFLPDLHVTYDGAEADVQIGHLLHQTSGLPFRTIASLPTDGAPDALARTVQSLNGVELDERPGTRHQYATANYDVLAAVLEKATGRPFEAYVRDEVLVPAGMTQSAVGTHEVPAARKPDQARGHKIGLLAAHPYDAPPYRGNTAAGYVWSSAEDMTKWLQLQLSDDALIRRSHEAPPTVYDDARGGQYAAGWYVTETNGKSIWHEGSNPAFSSFAILRPEEQLGVAVLANIDSAVPHWLGQAIMNLLVEQPLPEAPTDPYQLADKIAVWLSIPLLFALLFGTVRLWRGGRALRGYVREGLSISAGLFCALAILWPLAIALLPLVGLGLTWQFLLIWAPWTLTAAAGLLGLTGAVLALSQVPVLLLRKQRRTQLDLHKEVSA